MTAAAARGMNAARRIGGTSIQSPRRGTSDWRAGIRRTGRDRYRQPSARPLTGFRDIPPRPRRKAWTRASARELRRALLEERGDGLGMLRALPAVRSISLLDHPQLRDLDKVQARDLAGER